MDEEQKLLTRLETQMESVLAALAELRKEVREGRGDYVSRGEWMQRNSYVDSKFDMQGADISEIKTEIAGKRAPWWTLGAFILSAVAVGWSIFGPIL